MRAIMVLARGLGPALVLGGILVAGSCSLDKVGLGSKVDITPPKVSISNPVSGQYLAGTVHLTGTASDDLKVKSLTVRYPTDSGDKTAVVTVTGTSWNIDLPSTGADALKEGQNEITASVADDSGKVTTASVLVYVDNTPPTVLVTYPLSRGTTNSASDPTRPAVTANIDIKGEVYDVSPIQSVQVKLLKNDGTALTPAATFQKTADGTNTFLVRFPLKETGLLTDKNIYRFMITATDAAGNKNTWYYHSQDVYTILPAPALITDPPTAFPTINEIGRLDSLHTPDPSVPTGMAYSALLGLRLGIGATPKWGDFEYLQDSVPLIRFSNLDKTAAQNQNLLGLNSVITGNLIPPANAGSIDLSSVKIDIYQKTTIPLGSDTPVLSLTSANFASPPPGTKHELLSVGDSYAFTVDLLNLPPAPYYIKIWAKATGSDPTTDVAAFFVDSTAPNLFETQVGLGAPSVNTSTFTLGGTATATTGLDTISITENGTAVPAKSYTFGGSPTSGTWSITGLPTTGTDGTYNYELTLTSSSGKSSPTLYRTVTRDTAAPNVEITSLVPIVGTQTVNGIISFTAAASDGNGLSGVRYWLLPSASPQPAWAAGGSKTLTSPYADTIDTTTLTDNSGYTLWVLAQDKAGNVGAAQSALTVNQSSDKPTVTLTNMDDTVLASGQAGTNLQETGAKITGTITDDDGVDSSAISIVIDGGASTPVTLHGPDGKTTSFTYDLSTFSEGNHSLTITSYDKSSAKGGAAAVSGQSPVVWFAIDKSPPALAIVSPSTGSLQKANFTLSGTASDASGIAGSSVTIKNAVNATVGTATVTSGAWTFSVDISSLSDGDQNWTVTTADNYGKTATVPFSFKVDKAPPTVTATLPASTFTWYSGTVLAALGTAADTNGVTKVEWSTDSTNGTNGTWSPASGTTTWTASVPLSALTEGNLTFWVKATDAAGNVSTALSRPFGYDAAPPTVTETAVGSAGTVGRNALFNLQGTIADSNALTTLVVEQRKNGGAWVTIVSQTPSGTSQSWNTGNTLPRDPSTPANPLLADGTFDYRVTVTDAASKTAVTTGSVQIDTTPPVVTMSSPTASQWLSGTAFQASGTASDPASGSGVATVQISLDSGSTWTGATGTGSWTANLNLTALGEGHKTIQVRATDNAGNVSTPVTVAFGIDQSPPTLGETTSGIVSSTLVFRNVAVTLGGVATDANGVAHVVVSYQKDGGATVNLVDDTTDDGTWTATLPFAADHSLDGIYDVSVTATDGAGKTTSVTRRVQLDTQSPTLNITAPVASEIVSSTAYTIRGQVTDNGGKGITTLQYSTDNATWTNITQSGLNWSVANVNFSGTEGARTLYVRADDGLNPVTLTTMAFNYDTAPPVLSEALNTSSQVIKATTFTLSGTASDTNSLASVAITATKDGTSRGTLYNQAFSGSSPQAYLYSQTVNSGGSDDGLWVYTVTATDVAGRTTVLTRTVLIDATAPALPVINALSAPYYDASLPVSGSASDAGSGVQTMEYSFDNATWSALTGTDSWFATIVLSSALPTLSTDGVKTLYVRATDRAGNRRAQSATFRYDTAAPAITENNYSAATIVSTTGVTFAGAAQDFNGGALATSFVHVTVNGTVQPDISVSSNNWTWTYPNTTEGAAAIVFSVIDAAGRTASLTRNVLIDKTAPTVVITGPSAGDVVSGTSLTIAGTAADAGSGLASGGVEYSLDGTTWAAVDGTANWNKAITTSGEGAKTLSIRAKDNVNLVSTTATVNFNVDVNPPTLVEIMLGGNAKKNAAFSLGGTAGDTNGLATWDNDSNPLTPMVPYVEVSVNGAAATKVVVAAGNWTFPYTPSADGTIDFTMTATDVVGKTTSLTRTVTIDTTPPTISADGVITGLNVSTNQVNGLMTFRFSADDAGVGLEKNGSSQYVSYYKLVAHGSPDLTGTTAAAVTSWTAVPPSASSVFTFTFDTTTTADGTYDLYLAVRDAISGTPNVKVLKYATIIDINQDSDRPVVEFNNLDVAAIHNIDNTLGKDPVLLLTIQDDDKVKVSDLQYRIDIDNDGQFTSTKDFWNGALVNGQNSMTPDGNTNSKWENESVWYNFDEVPSSDGSLVQAKIKLTGFPQGVYGIQVRARDNTDASFWSAIFDSATNHTWQKSGIVPFVVDYGPPALTITSPQAGVFRNSLTVTGTTQDPLGVTRVRYTFDGSTYITMYANASPLDPMATSLLVPGVKYIVTFVGTTNWSAVGAGSSPAVGTSFTATGTASGSGTAKVDPSGSIPFTATADLSALTTGDWSLQVVSTDVTGSEAIQTSTISVDKDGPTVTVNQPAPSTTVNGTSVKISGEAADNRKVGAVFVWSGLTAAADPALPSQTALPSVPNPNGLYNPGGYTQVSGAGVWNTTIDTTAQVLTAANGYRVRVVAVDAVGNVGIPLDVPLTVDQSTDRPVIAFSNLSLVTASRLPAGNLTIIGTVTDDDAVNHASIQVRLDRNGDGDYNDANEDWTDISTPPATDTGVVSWSHTISDMTSQGNRHVQVRVRDVNAPVYGANSGFDTGYATTYGWAESPSVAFYIDNGPPALDLTGPTIGQKFNAGQFTLTGSSTDTNGIQKITVWVDDNDNQVRDSGETTTLTGPTVAATAMVAGFTYTIQTVGSTDFTAVGAAANTVGTTFVASGPGTGSGVLKDTALTYDDTPYTINSVISSFSNSTKPVKAVQVISYDVSGASTVRDLSIVYDPVTPTVTFNSPAEASTVNGTVRISGLADDNYQLSKVFYNVSPAAASPAFPGDYTELVGQTYSWSVNVPTLALTDGAYKVRVVAQDSSLNTSATPAVLNLTVNQASDRPVISVLTLNTAGTAVQNLLPASLQVSGTISDDDAVAHGRIEIRTRSLPAGAWSAWTAISGPPASDVSLATWNHTFTGFTDGQYEFQLRTADTLAPAYGTDSNFDSNLASTWGWSESAAVQFAVDLNLPTGTILTPVQSSSQRTDVVISGNASDASGIKKVSIAFDTGSGYGAETTLTTTNIAPIAGNPAVSWTSTYSVASVADGQIFYRVTVTDSFDKVRTYEQYFTLDKTAPTVGFDTTAANPDTVTGAYNGTVTFRAHADDNIKINKVYYQFSPTTPGAPDASFTGWTLAAATYTWTAPLDTTTINAGTSDQTDKLWALSVDGAGNLSSMASLTFVINQSSDQPVVTLTAPTAAQTFDVNAKALGTVTDDDGLASVQVRIVPSASSFASDGSDYVAVTSPASVSGKSINLEHVLSTLLDGDYKMQVRARDVAFTSSAATPNNETQSAVVNFSIDTAPPSVSLSSIAVQDRYGGADHVISSGFNGSYVNNDLTLTMHATDASGIASVQVSTDGSTWTNATSQGSGNYTFALAIPLNQSLDGTRNIQYRATDGHAKVTSAIVTLIVDTLEPAVGFTSPTSMPASSSTDAPNVNGTVTVLGTVSDSSALASVAVTGGTDNVALTNLGNNLGWKVTFNSGLYASAAHAIGQGSNIWRFPVSVNAIDIAGNKSVPANSVGWIDIDPNSDNPIVTIASPTNGSSVSGSFLISGSVSDDDGAQSALLQVDLNNDGIYGVNGGFPGYLDLNGNGNHTGDFEDETVAKVITVNNGAWSIMMNTVSELNKSNLVARGLASATGTIEFKVTPVDINGLQGAAQTQTVYIDASAPVISGLAADGTTPVADPTPATGSLQKDTLTVRALFKDDQSIPSANMQVSLDGGSNFVAVNSIAGATISGDVGSGNPYTYRIAIPINTATAVSGGNGDLQISMKLTDQTFKQTTSSVTYHVDNTLPTVAWDTPATLPAPQSGVYTFKGNANDLNNEVYGQTADSGTISGIDHIDVYFVKNTNQLYDPKNGTFTTATNSVSGDLLYNGGGTVATGIPFTQDAWTTANAADAHHYAVRIDKRTELGQFDSNPSLGDADGFQESLKAKTGYDEWYAFFDSTKLPDGPLTVYFVTYDQAGNKRYSTASAQVANNPPSVSSFVVGGNALSGNPPKVKYSGTVPLTINSTDAGGNAGIVANNGKLTVDGRYGANGGGDLDLANVKALTPWYYGKSSVYGATGWKADFTAYGTNGASVAGIASINTVSDGFVEGDWYHLTAQVQDNDGNIATSGFYLRVLNSDVTAPVITFPALDQTNVSQWTSKTTPLSINVAAGSISGNLISVTLPSWISDNTKVVFTGTTAPANLTPGTVYYIRSVSTTGSPVQIATFNLAASSGGAALSLGAVTGTYHLASGGHVEAASTSQYPSGSGTADVSGTIKLTGTVHDDTDVQTLTLSIDGGSAITLTPLNKTGDAISGYTYDWSYNWDSSTIATVAKRNVSLVITAQDFKSPIANSSTSTQTVDVLPYVLTITDSTGLSSDVLRGATGKYSITKDASNLLTVRGYNLSQSATNPTAYLSATKDWTAGTSGTATRDGTYPSNQVTVTKNWAKSGYLTLVVNSEGSGNNYDDNTQTVNQETTTDPRTAQWNDDRYLWVWANTQIVPASITNMVTQPTIANLTYYNSEMVMNANQPEFSFTDDSSGIAVYTTGDTAASRRSGYRLMRPAGMAEATVSGTLQRFIATSFDSTWTTSGDNTGFLEVTGFADQTTDGNGQANGPSVITDGGPRWPTIQGIDYYAPGNTTLGVYRSSNRFPHTRITADPSPTVGGANLALAYFDANSYHRSLNLVGFRMTGNGTTNNNLNRALNGYNKSTDVIEIPGTKGFSSPYFDMVKVGQNGVAVAYYDETNRQLKLTTSANAIKFNTSGDTTTEGLTNAPSPEVSTVTISNSIRNNWAGKYFTFNNGTASYDVWFLLNTGSGAAVASGSFIVGSTYTITTSGSTNFTTIGASANTVGTVFVATGAGTGSGTATPTKPTTLTSPNNIRIDINTQNNATNSAANQTALGTTIAAALNAAGASINVVGNAPFTIYNTNTGTATDIASNLAAGTTVGSVAIPRQGTAANATWNAITLDNSADVGEYVSMVYDSTSDKLYIAYYDFDNANLKIARVDWNSGAPTLGNVSKANIDNYLSAGSWTSIMMINDTNLTGQSSPQPMIAYYSDSYNGTKKPIRFAFPRFDATTGSLTHGTTSSGTDDTYSGGWEVVAIGAMSTPQGGADQFNRVKIGAYTNGGLTLPVLGWQGTKLEYTKLQPNN